MISELRTSLEVRTAFLCGNHCPCTREGVAKTRFAVVLVNTSKVIGTFSSRGRGARGRGGRGSSQKPYSSLLQHFVHGMVI